MTFEYRNGSLHAEAVDLNQLAHDYGTPLYVYSAQQIRANWQQFADHWPQPHLLCYAVKANSNLGVLNLLARLGAGFDIVSGGELARVIAAGGQAS
ncbi:MAG TPA: diaminopimelate decarboxylase, partial [Pseudidiomarina sp.]|nr:diaminopimelate decarboxylase [Pseudidiomarina sp.]